MGMFFCHFCRRERQNANGLCSGCGSDVAHCGRKKPDVMTNTVPQCPGCGRRGVTQEEDRWYCVACKVWYERPDQAYLDSRPENNAIKREEFEERQARRKKAARHRSRGSY